MMKTPVKITLIVLGSIIGLLLVGLGSLIVYVNQQDKIIMLYVDELNIDKNDFKSEFEEIYQLTLDNYSLYQAKALNMDSIHDSFLQRIDKADVDKVEFGYILKEFFSSLKVGHSFVYLIDHTAGYSPIFIENRIFVDSPNEYLSTNGFKDKDEIIAVNGTAVSEWLDKHEKYTSASTDEARRLNTALSIFRSWADTTATYKVVRGVDTLEIELPLKTYELLPKEAVDNPSVEWSIINDTIGYINIHSMMDPVVDDFVKAYRNVRDLPYMIVDIRQNGGGNSGNGMDIAEYFIKKPQPHCVAPSFVMEPQRDAYKGRLYLLISTETFSAAESFALDIKESGNAILIGSATAGDTGNGPETFHTTNGIYFRIPTREPSKSPKGFPMEGIGISPDYKVEQTVSDFKNSHDTALDFTIDLISK
jgi:carboxyl-terminal processing protease